jgi:hypothetical protein
VQCDTSFKNPSIAKQQTSARVSNTCGAVHSFHVQAAAFGFVLRIPIDFTYPQRKGTRKAVPSGVLDRAPGKSSGTQLTNHKYRQPTCTLRVDGRRSGFAGECISADRCTLLLLCFPACLRRCMLRIQATIYQPCPLCSSDPDCKAGG